MILYKNNNNRYAARQGAVGEYVMRVIYLSIYICITYIDILHILVAACPHLVTPLPLLLFLSVFFPYILWVFRASWKCYQFFTIYINTEIFLRSSVSFMSPRCPFPAQLHLQLRIVILLLLGTGLRILIFDKRTGNLSPVSVRRGAAQRGCHHNLVGWPSANWSTATETEAATATKAATAAAQSQREESGYESEGIAWVLGVSRDVVLSANKYVKLREGKRETHNHTQTHTLAHCAVKHICNLKTQFGHIIALIITISAL